MMTRLVKTRRTGFQPVTPDFSISLSAAPPSLFCLLAAAYCLLLFQTNPFSNPIPTHRTHPNPLWRSRIKGLSRSNPNPGFPNEPISLPQPAIDLFFKKKERKGRICIFRIVYYTSAGSQSQIFGLWHFAEKLLGKESLLCART
jgi:hypothetical protein